MPRQAMYAYLYRRRDTEIWVIRDTGRVEFSTRTRNRREAEGALAKYISGKDQPAGPSTPDQMGTAEALTIYGNERAPEVKDPVRIAHAIQALVPIVGSLSVAGLASEVCRRYAKTRRKSPDTIRKELGVLQAAVNYCHSECYLTSAPKLRFPARPPARDRGLIRGEIAKLLRAAHRNPRSRHLARFILVAYYTGTWSEAMLRMHFMPTAASCTGTEPGKLRQPSGARYVVDVAASGSPVSRPHGEGRSPNRASFTLSRSWSTPG